MSGVGGDREMKHKERYKVVANQCVEKLMEREQLYNVPEPFELMSDDDYVSMMRVKLFRVQQGSDMRAVVDDLEDLIAYAVVLLDRWKSRTKVKEVDEQ